MPCLATYTPDAPDRATLDALPGPVLLEFGAGRRLGRSFRVKLWPTLILLQGGVELGRVVRPTSAAELAPLLALLPAAS